MTPQEIGQKESPVGFEEVCCHVVIGPRGKELLGAFRSREQPLGDSHQENGDVSPTTAKN